MGRRAGFWVCSIALPLMLGAAIYVLRGPDTPAAALALRLGVPAGAGLNLPPLLRSHLCDMLWAYALTASLSALTGRTRRGALAALGIGIAVSAVLELLQLTGAAAGTFDPLDIAAEALACASAYVIINRNRKRENQ